MDGLPFPKITQDGRDGDEETGYIANMRDGAHAGFKYFACEGISRVSIRVRGYCKGAFGVKTAWDGPVLGWIPVGFPMYGKNTVRTSAFRTACRRSTLYIRERAGQAWLPLRWNKMPGIKCLE